MVESLLKQVRYKFLTQDKKFLSIPIYNMQGDLSQDAITSGNFFITLRTYSTSHSIT
jgi:hypothetical protein